MGVGIKALVVLVAVSLVLFCAKVQAQERQEVDLDFFYNEWALSISESNDNILVYSDEDDFIFDDIPYNSSLNLKFTSYNNTFYLKHFGSKQLPARSGNGLTFKG